MKKEDHRHVKLNEVYKQLTAIKNQLQALMQPLPHPQSPKVLPKTQLISHMHSRVPPRQPDKQKDNLESQQVKTAETDQNKEIVGKSPKVAHLRSFYSPPKEFPNPQNSSTQQSKTLGENIVSKNNRAYGINHFCKMADQLHFIPKIKFNSLTKEQKSTPKAVPHNPNKNQAAPRRKPTHGRHATHFQIHQEDRTSPRKQRLQTENDQCSDKDLLEKKIVMFKRNNQPVNDKKKRLVRMRSDFTGSDNEKDDDVQAACLKSKQRQLQEELKRKQESMAFMLVELQEIERNFKQLEGNLLEILTHHELFKGKLTDCNINSALHIVLGKLDLQSHQIQELNRLCDKLKSKNDEQAKNIQTFEKQLQQKGKEIAQWSEKVERCNSQLAAISSKLEVAVSENRLKDEFIVKLLSSRSQNTHQAMSQQLSETLESYLSRCGYPSNRLLDKLTEEQAEIDRLKALLDSK